MTILASFAASAATGLAKTAIDKIGQALSPDAAKQAKAKKTADDFETMFLEQNFEQLFAHVGEEGPMGSNGIGGDVYRSMMVKEYAGSIVKSGGIGLSSQIYSEILKLQEGASAHAARG
jgi:peptidoglycan hydrolase FlgJ